MSIKIITDNTCDLPKELCEKLNIEIVPVHVVFKDKIYTPGIDLTTEEFYKKLSEAEELPTTVLISPQQFLEAFKKYLDQGDEILGLFISKELSGTFNSAQIAKNELSSDKIYLVDTKQATAGLGILVLYAQLLIEQGLEIEKIASILQKDAKRIRIYAVIDTLKYLHKGGRLSSTSAILGGMLNIKPIITLEEGKVKNIAKARGNKKGYEEICNYLLKTPIDENLPKAFVHANAPALLEDFKSVVLKKVSNLKNLKFTHCDIGPVVGTHAGPGCVGIIYFAKES